MAGTVTQSLVVLGHGDNINATKKELIFAWTADASAATVPTSAVTNFDGWYISKIQTNPGTTAPTAGYDITLVDADGIDLLDGAGLDRSASLSESVAASARIPNGGFTFTLANNLVNSAVGVCRIFLEK